MTAEHPPRDPRRPHRFYLERDEDESGVSGTGRVAAGVLFHDGRTVISWFNDANDDVDTEGNGLAIYDSLADAIEIHGHDGRTRFAFVDERPPDVRAPERDDQ